MKKLLVIANPYPPMASAGTTRVVRFLRHLPERRLGADGADGDGRPGRRRCRPACAWSARAGAVAEAAARRRPARARSVNRWVACPTPTSPGSGRPSCKGRELLRGERFDAIFSSSPRPSVHLVAAVLSRARRPAVAGRLPRPVVDLPVPHVPDARRTRRAHARLEAWALRPRRRRDRRQPADRRRPRRAAPVARRPRPRAPQRLRPRRAAGGRLARRGLLARPHRPAVRPRAAGRARSSTALAALPPDVKALFVGVDESRVRPDADRLGLGDRVRVEPLVPLAARPRLPARRRRAAARQRAPAGEHVEQGVRVPAGRPADLRHLAGRLRRPRRSSPRSAAARACCPTTPWPRRSPPSSPPCATARRRSPTRRPCERYELGRLTAELAGAPRRPAPGSLRPAGPGRAATRAGRMPRMSAELAAVSATPAPAAAAAPAQPRFTARRRRRCSPAAPSSPSLLAAAATRRPLAGARACSSWSRSRAARACSSRRAPRAPRVGALLRRWPRLAAGCWRCSARRSPCPPCRRCSSSASCSPSSSTLGVTLPHRAPRPAAVRRQGPRPADRPLVRLAAARAGLGAGQARGASTTSPSSSR